MFAHPITLECRGQLACERVSIYWQSACAAAAVWPAISKSIWRRASFVPAPSPPTARTYRKKQGAKRSRKVGPARGSPQGDFHSYICEHAAGCKKQNEAKPAATGSCPRVSSLLERRATLYFWLECRHGYKRNTGEMNAEGCFWPQSLHRRVLTKELSGGPFTRFSHSPPQVITHESNSSLLAYVL